MPEPKYIVSPPGKKGGYRPPNPGNEPGGRPVKKEQKDAYTLLAKAKAKNETYKANREELRYKEEVGELVKADQARDAMSVMLKAVMLTLDTLTEVTEREAKLTPEQADTIQRIIDRERRNLHIALLAADGKQ